MYKNVCVSLCSKRLNYVNHARRLAEGDWAGPDSDGEEEEMEKKEEGDGKKEEVEDDEEGMEIEKRKLPRHYANQVGVFCVWIVNKQRHCCFFQETLGRIV